MDLGLAGKRALVTGSTKGIGLGVARSLAQEGVVVAVHGRDGAQAEQVAATIGGHAVPVAADLAASDGADRLAEGALAALGGVDILVNNAGLFRDGAWMTIPPAQWLETYAVNVVSMVRLIQRLAPAMRERGWGRIINVSSVGGTMPTGTTLADYSASKAAVTNMTVGLAKELAGSGVTANVVSPGLVKTPGTQAMVAGRLSANADDWAAMEQAMLARGFAAGAGRLGEPEDIGFVVTMLASPRAGWITGANLHADGGTLPTVT